MNLGSRKDQTNYYEVVALRLGTIINTLCSVTGFVFFLITKSMSILLDTLISVILCVSTVISIFVSNKIVTDTNDNLDSQNVKCKDNSKLESKFLIFRALIMLGIIIYTIVDGAICIYDFQKGTLQVDYNADNISLIIYGVMMTSLCFLITFTYSFFNNKLSEKSEIINIEIKASIYDGLVTIFAISSLLLFSNISFLEPVKDIGDSITVIILSLFYLVTPIKELKKNIKRLKEKE